MAATPSAYAKLAVSAADAGDQFGRLHAAVTEAIGAGAIHLTIDLHGPKKLDTATIHALLAVLHRARERGGSVALAVSHRQMIETLRVTGLDRTFRVITTERVEDTTVPHSRGKRSRAASWSERFLVGLALSAGISGGMRSPADAKIALRPPTAITLRLAPQPPPRGTTQPAR